MEHLHFQALERPMSTQTKKIEPVVSRANLSDDPFLLSDQIVLMGPERYQMKNPLRLITILDSQGKKMRMLVHMDAHSYEYFHQAEFYATLLV